MEQAPTTYLKLAARRKRKTKKKNLSFNLLSSEKISIIQPSFSTLLPVPMFSLSYSHCCCFLIPPLPSLSHMHGPHKIAPPNWSHSPGPLHSAPFLCCSYCRLLLACALHQSPLGSLPPRGGPVISETVLFYPLPLRPTCSDLFQSPSNHLFCPVTGMSDGAICFYGPYSA